MSPKGAVLMPLTNWYLRTISPFLKANHRQRRKLIVALNKLVKEWKSGNADD